MPGALQIRRRASSAMVSSTDRRGGRDARGIHSTGSAGFSHAGSYSQLVTRRIGSDLRSHCNRRDSYLVAAQARRIYRGTDCRDRRPVGRGPNNWRWLILLLLGTKKGVCTHKASLDLPADVLTVDHTGAFELHLHRFGDVV